MGIDSGVQTSLHSHCHHQIIFEKFDLKVSHVSPYERIVWLFKHVNSDHIKSAIYSFDWKFELNNLDTNDQVSVFNNSYEYCSYETLLG